MFSKIILAAAIAFGATGGAAVAADASWARPAHNWAGFYVGGFFGAESGATSTSIPITTSGPSGADIGVDAYYSFQGASNWVVSPFVAVPLASQTGTLFSSPALKIDWALVGGVRVGYAFDRWLPYGFVAGVVGGGEWVGNSKNTHTGYAAGLGFDYALDDRWSVGARYAYVAVGPQSYSGVSASWSANSIAATVSFKLK